MTYKMLAVQINKKIAGGKSYEDLLMEVAKKTMDYLLMCYLQCEIHLRHFLLPSLYFRMLANMYHRQ